MAETDEAVDKKKRRTAPDEPKVTAITFCTTRGHNKGILSRIEMDMNLKNEVEREKTLAEWDVVFAEMMARVS